MRALLSVYDKTGLVEFAGTLSGLGFSLVASGNTSASARRQRELTTSRSLRSRGHPRCWTAG